MMNVSNVLSILVLTASVACAADKPVVQVPVAAPAAPVAVAAPAVPVVASEKIQSGVVKSISLADAAKGTKSEIVITTGPAQEMEFLVTSTTTLYGGSAKAISLNQIVLDNKVAITYVVTPEGVKEAKSIRIM